MPTAGGHPTRLTDLLAARGETGSGSYLKYHVETGRYVELTSRQLDVRSAWAAHRLRRLYPLGPGSEPAAEVMLAIRDPLSFVVALFAVLRAGLVPVPAPGRPLSHSGHLQRLRSIAHSASLVGTITDSDATSLGRALPGCSVVPFEQLVRPSRGQVGEELSQDIAYVQYTSGSVTSPKPVRLRHQNVLAQLRQAAEAFGEDPDSVAVTWVPLYHDMGLVTGVLRPLWTGYTSVLLDPIEFVREPAVWPLVMSHCHATHTSAPDFGYNLCARKVTDPGVFDLRRLRVARSAGELVRGSTLRLFAERFRPAGFDPAAFTPSYGLAEATLTVTAVPLGRPPSSLHLSTEALRRGEVRPAPPGPGRTEIVSCGRPLPDTRVEILDPVTGELQDGRALGEVWIAGHQVAPATAASWTVDGRLGHRTGDLGFMHEGELYVLGRGTERFQVAGENFSSEVVEPVVWEADDRLRPGRAAVFLGQRAGWPEPVPVVIAECRDTSDLDPRAGAELATRIVAAVRRRAGLAVRCVWLVRPGAMATTTSGKLRREQCRNEFEDDRMESLYRYERVRR